MEQLVKRNITQELDPVRQPLLWQSKDLDNVVSAYQDFLVAMAQLGFLVDQAVLVKALKKFFEGDAIVLKNFAQVMSKCLTYCKRTSSSISSGAKTAPAVVKVARAWAKRPPSEMESSRTPQIVESPHSSSDLEIELTTTADEDATKALAMAKAMFSGSASSSRPLKRNASIFSVASSEAEAPAAELPAASTEPPPTKAKKAEQAKVHNTQTLIKFGTSDTRDTLVIDNRNEGTLMHDLISAS